MSCSDSSITGEFDPGSGRTLAACLTHASRTGPGATPVQWQVGAIHARELAVGGDEYRASNRSPWVTVPPKEAPANSVPAAAVIRRVRALSGITGRKGRVGGSLSCR